MTRIQILPLKEYALGIYDGPHATPKESPDGAIFLGIKNITADGQLDLSNIRFVSEQEFPKWTRRVTPKGGDVVLTYEATLHRYAIIPNNFRGCLGRRVALVRPNPLKVHSRYLLYYFLSRQWRKIIESYLITGATVDRIPIEKLPDFPVALPDLDTQLHIASILSAYDDLIENNRRRMSLLEEAARQLYREWFVRLCFPSYERTRIVNGLPEGWDSGTIADFYDTTSGGTPSRANSDFYDGDINWVKTQELNDDFIFETDEKITEHALSKSSAKLFPIDTLLVSIYGGSNIGRTGILAQPAATNQACCALFPRDVRANYIYGALYFQEQRQHLIGLAQGAAQTNISQQVIRSLPMRMPSASLMVAFTDSLTPAFQQMKTLKRENEKLADARDLLLPKLMNGEIAV